MFDIRLLAAGDEGVLGALHDECFDLPFSAAGFEALLASPGMWAALAWRDGGRDDGVLGGRDEAAAGYVMARSIAGEAEIVSIGVRPGERRQGVGAALLADAMVRSVVLGARAIFLEVAEDNTAAIALYRSAGFEPVGCRPGYYPRKSSSPIAALIMRHIVKKSVS